MPVIIKAGTIIRNATDAHRPSCAIIAMTRGVLFDLYGW